MKKYISILALETKVTIYKLLVVLAALAAAELVDFYLALQRERKRFFGVEGVISVSFRDVLTEGHTEIIFGIGLTLAAVVLVWSASEKGKVKTNRFWWRLSVERKQVTFLRVGYHTLCFVMLFAAQVCLIPVMYQMYCRGLGIPEISQALFIDFYRNAFLHNILPLSDGFRSFRLLVTIMMYGMGTVYIGYVEKGKNSPRTAGVVIYLTAWMTLLTLTGIDLLMLDVFCTIISVAYLVIMALIFIDKIGAIYYEG